MTKPKWVAAWDRFWELCTFSGDGSQLQTEFQQQFNLVADQLMQQSLTAGQVQAITELAILAWSIGREEHEKDHQTASAKT